MGLIQEYVGFEESPDIDVKVNTIIDFWSNPCNAPYSVYIETLYPALGRMFLALVDTSLLDIARSYLRPRQGLTRGHNRKKGRRRGKTRGIPDTADLVARMIPGASIHAGMEYGANTKFLWQIDGIIQRGLWYIVIIDATTEGLYWWAQGIKEERFCQPTNRPGLMLTNPHVSATSFFGQWFPSPGWLKQWGEPGFQFFISSLTIPTGKWHLTYWAEYENESTGTGLVSVRLNGTGPSGQGSIFLGPHERAPLVFGVTVTGPTVIVFEQKVNGSPFIEGRTGIVTARAVP